MIQEKLEYNEIISRDMDERLKSMQREGIDPEPDFDMAQASTRQKELQYWRSKMTMEERELENNVSTFIKIAADLIESVATKMDISIVHTKGLSEKISTALAEGRFAPAIRQFVQTGGGNGLSFMTKNPSLNFLFTFGTIILSNHLGQKPTLVQAPPVPRPISPVRSISPTQQPVSHPPAAWEAQAFTDFFDEDEPAAKVDTNVVEPVQVDTNMVEPVQPMVVEPPKMVAVEPVQPAKVVAVEPVQPAKVVAIPVEVEPKAPMTNTFVAIDNGHMTMNFDPLIKNLSSGVKEYMSISKEKKLIEESRPVMAKVTVI